MIKSNNIGGNRNYNRFQQSRQQQPQYQHQQEQNADPWEAETSSSMQQPFFMLNQQMNNFQQIPKTVYTVHCGECRPKDEGVRVKISGKVVKRPRTGRFLEIKDMKGCTQLVRKKLEFRIIE